MSALSAISEYFGALLDFWWKWHLAIQNSQRMNGEKLDLWLISLGYHLTSGRANKVRVGALYIQAWVGRLCFCSPFPSSRRAICTHRDAPEVPR
jgi:hypothetical protein